MKFTNASSYRAHECEAKEKEEDDDEEQADEPKRKQRRVAVEEEDEEGVPENFEFLLVVVHTSPSGGVKPNAAEIASLRGYYPGLPMIFAGDWYMPSDAKLSTGQLLRAEEEGGWEDLLRCGGLQTVRPPGKTNLPHAGSGMNADYYIVDTAFQGTAHVVHKEGKEDHRYDTLYGWHEEGIDVSDHTVVEGNFRTRRNEIDESKYPNMRRGHRGSQQREAQGSIKKLIQVGAKAAPATKLNDARGSPKLKGATRIQGNCPGKRGRGRGRRAEEEPQKVRKKDVPFKILSWNINHFGKRKKNKKKREETKKKNAKLGRKAAAIRELLDRRPHILVLQEVNSILSIKAEVNWSGYKLAEYRLVQIDLHNPLAPGKIIPFREYFPCFFDPRLCEVNVEGVWDGENQHMYPEIAVRYSSTRPAMVYRVTIFGEPKEESDDEESDESEGEDRNLDEDGDDGDGSEIYDDDAEEGDEMEEGGEEISDDDGDEMEEGGQVEEKRGSMRW